MSTFDALAAAFRGEAGALSLGTKPHSDSAEYPVWRFVTACRDLPYWAPDHAVLLRQVICWHGGSIVAGALPPGLMEYSRRSGIESSSSALLNARPFAPEWLEGDRTALSKSVDSRPAMRRPVEAVAGEPYLRSLGEDILQWQSQAQKEAAWTAMTAPGGSTTLIALPTGTGKSLTFQLLSRFGSGLTLVVVPTVALAIDQYRSAMERLSHIPDLNPRYFAADDAELDPNHVADEIRQGHTRLVFTSPEACVSGRLRSALTEAARSGRLENLVVDEAHIIETWGVYFRVDFQMLASRQRQWFDLTEGTLRTFLLSATFTPRSTVVLKNLFGQRGDWQEFVSQRLRPELTYFAHNFLHEDDRAAAVFDCMWHLPRPAVLFTTEVESAKDFAQSLRNEGFRRIGCFHGETPSAERRRLLEAWRNDELDVMVATSAFGLGVDKPDVRTVVHACFPETLHRYYQEAGRAGRDGYAAACLLLSTRRDKRVAEKLLPKLLSESVAQRRWEALWHHSTAVDVNEHVYKVPTESKRVELLGTRTWSQNVLWNKRLILQLVRAGLLDLLDVTYEQGEDNEERLEWVVVRLNFQPLSKDVGRMIDPQRTEEIRACQEGLQQLESYISGDRPLCRLLRRVYGDTMQVACGGCPGCRRLGRAERIAVRLEVPEQQDTTPLLEVVMGWPNPTRLGKYDRFVSLLNDLVERRGVRRLVCGHEHQGIILRALDSAFGKHRREPYRLDTVGPDEPFRVADVDAVAAFHLNLPEERLLALRRGRRLTHLLCGITDPLDANGRYPLESKGARIYSSPEQWLSQG